MTTTSSWCPENHFWAKLAVEIAKSRNCELLYLDHPILTCTLRIIWKTIERCQEVLIFDHPSSKARLICKIQTLAQIGGSCQTCLLSYLRRTWVLSVIMNSFRCASRICLTLPRGIYESSLSHFISNNHKSHKKCNRPRAASRWHLPSPSSIWATITKRTTSTTYRGRLNFSAIGKNH